MDKKKYAKKLLDYLNNAPTPFQSVDLLKAMLDKAGATEIKDSDPWNLERTKAYYIIKDGTQIRNVVQALTIFAQGNKDSYPLPSMLDVNNQTVAAGLAGDASTQWTKNNTSNILSILIFNSSISPELCYSPAESSSLIRIDAAYENTKPAKAAVPARRPPICARS